MSLTDELKSRISSKLNLDEAKTYVPKLASIEVRPTSKTDPRHLGTIPTFGEKSNLGNDDEYNTALAAAHEAGKKTFAGKYDISHVDHRGQFIRAGSVAKVRRMMKEEVESLDEISQEVATRAYGRRANNAYELGDRYTNDAEKAAAEKESDKASKAYDRIGRKFGKAGQKKADAQADAVTYGGKAPYKESSSLTDTLKSIIEAKLMEGEPSYYKGKNTGPLGPAPAGTIAADRADPVKGKKIRDELKAINSRPKKPIEPFIPKKD